MLSDAWTKQQAQERVWTEEDRMEVLHEGSQHFWRTRQNVDIIIVEHKNYRLMEIVTYSPAVDKEALRIYLHDDLLFDLLDTSQFEEILRAAKEPFLRQHKVPDTDRLMKGIAQKAKVSYILNRLSIEECSLETRTFKIGFEFNFRDRDGATGALDKLRLERPRHLKRFVSLHYRSLVAGEISECYENLAADQQMILELRKKAAAAERRADKLLTAMERWRLPVLYMKLLRNQFLSNRDAAIWEKVSKNFDNRDIMAAIKNALEEPLVPAPRPLVQKCAPVVAKVDTNNPKPPSVGSDPPSVWSANSIVAGLGTVARSYKRSFKTVADLNEGDGDLLDDACGPACGPREKQASRVGGTSRRASQNPLLRQNSNATRAYRPPTPNSRPLTGTPAKKREVSKAPADVPPPSGLLSFVTSLFSSSAKTDCESPVAKTDPGNFSSDYTDLAADTTSTCVDNSCGPEMFSTELEVTIPKKPTDEPSVPIISKKTSQRCHSPIKNASLRQEVSQEVTAGFFRQSTLNEKSASRHHAEETSVKRGEETSTRLGEKRRPRFHGEETSARHLGEEGATHHEERMRSIYGEERSRRIYAAETSRRQERLSRVQHDDRERSFRGERSTREVSLNSATKKRAKQQTPTQESHQRGRGASDNIGNTVSRILAAMGV